ncbi:ethanolamine-phosphate phospho-lyase, partial [Mytilus galloprovincialis]
MEHFWNRWKSEYITTLREFHRQTGNNCNLQTIQVGDVVQVQDDKLPKNRWNIAVVDKLITGNDGFTRAAIIRTRAGRTSRPIVKLYPLEIQTNINNLDDKNDDTSNSTERLTRVLPKREASVGARENIKKWTTQKRACKLHFESAPLKIVQASRQYMYDDTGNEYLDCIGNISHVGHCHPHVTRAGQDQLGTLVASTGYLNEKSVEYAKRMIETLPEKLCVCFMVNSGSEANDLAVRLCRSYTGHHDVMVIDHAFHGNVSVIADLSPFKWQKLGLEKKDWVHVVPFPDTYRGKYREDSVNPGLLYANEARNIIQSAHEKKRKIAAFLCEPMMVTAGVVEYPPHFLSQTFRAVHEAGGLCIIDEVNTGLGRTGDHFWAFQSQ